MEETTTNKRYTMLTVQIKRYRAESKRLNTHNLSSVAKTKINLNGDFESLVKF